MKPHSLSAQNAVHLQSAQNATLLISISLEANARHAQVSQIVWSVHHRKAARDVKMKPFSSEAECVLFAVPFLPGAANVVPNQLALCAQVPHSIWEATVSVSLAEDLRIAWNAPPKTLAPNALTLHFSLTMENAMPAARPWLVAENAPAPPCAPNAVLLIFTPELMASLAFPAALSLTATSAHQAPFARDVSQTPSTSKITPAQAVILQ